MAKHIVPKLPHGHPEDHGPSNPIAIAARDKAKKRVVPKRKSNRPGPDETYAYDPSKKPKHIVSRPIRKTP